MTKTTTKRKPVAKAELTLDLTAALPVKPRPKLTPSYDLSRLAPMGGGPAIVVDPAPVDDGLPPVRSTYVEDRSASEPFGTWLVKQKDRDGLLGQLATAAAGDRALGRAATPDDVRKRLVDQQADGDMHAALDDAEVDWLAL